MSTILLLDHDPALRDQLDASLTNDGHVVIIAASHGDALALLRMIPVNLVIANLSVPGLDWAGFCAQSRALPGYAQLPVILVSTGVGQEIQPSADYTAFIRMAAPLPALKPLVRCSLRTARQAAVGVR